MVKYHYPCLIPGGGRKVKSAIWTSCSKLYNRLFIYLCGVACGKDVSVIGSCFFYTRKKNEISLGDFVVLQSRGESNPVGLVNPTVLDTRGGGKITIGNYSGLSSVVISSRSCVAIGEHVKVGGNVRIFDHDFHALDAEIRRTPDDTLNIRTKPIEIGDDVFIGTNAMILKGTRIGARSIVAAGSVVFGLDIPPDSLVRGNPALIVPRKR